MGVETFNGGGRRNWFFLLIKRVGRAPNSRTDCRTASVKSSKLPPPPALFFSPRSI